MEKILGRILMGEVHIMWDIKFCSANMEQLSPFLGNAQKTQYLFEVQSHNGFKVCVCVFGCFIRAAEYLRLLSLH